MSRARIRKRRRMPEPRHVLIASLGAIALIAAVVGFFGYVMPPAGGFVDANAQTLKARQP